MNYKFVRALKIYEDKLVDDIIVTDIIPELRSSSYFTKEDEEYINHEITSERKATKLLEILSEKDNECYKFFLDILSRTNKELFTILNSKPDDNRIVRKRQFNMEDILIKGDIPVCTDNYIPRKEEKDILNLIESNSRKPILIHGIIGSGKTSIISQILRNQELFEEKFLNCCWMTIGNLNESDVVIKLQILLKKLNFNKKNAELTMSNIPEILVEDIKKRLSDRTTLLIIHDVRSSEVMKYFTFHEKYIVISIMSNLFSRGTADEVYIPEIFTDEQCDMLIKKNAIKNDYNEKIIKKSGKHPMYLDWICNLVKAHEGSNRLLEQLDFEKATQISKQCIDILDESLQDYFIMLLILPLDESVTIELLAIYWSVQNGEAFRIIKKLCDNNLMTKKYNDDYNCNMYGVHNFYLDCLKNSIHKDKFEAYEEMMVERFLNKFKTWIAIDIPDSFFFKFYSAMLFRLKDFEKLSNLYCNYSFIAAKIAVSGINESVYDYEKYRPPLPDNKWVEFEAFLKKNTHNLTNLPKKKSITIKINKIFTRLIQCGLHEMKESFTYKSAFENTKLSQKMDFWNWINPTKSIKIWEIKKDIKLVDINEHYILMSTSDSLVLLIELNSGKFIFSCHITENPIILVKFISSMDILIINSNAQFWFFNSYELVRGMKTLLIDYDEENDNEMDQVLSVETNSQNFLLIGKYLENTLPDNFFQNYKSQSLDDGKMDTNKLQVEVFCNKIYFFNSNEANTDFVVYDLKNNFVTQFTIIGSTKKYVFNSNNSTLYSLQDDGVIKLYNEHGTFNPELMITNEKIIDFIINESDIFRVSTKKVYKNKEHIFSVEDNSNISTISTINNKGLLALTLSNDTLQIWDYQQKKLKYSLHDSKFNNAYFLDNIILITTDKTKVAKWEIKYLNDDTNNNINHYDNNNSQPISYYREKFITKTSNSLLFLVLQTFKNEIEFCTYDNENFIKKKFQRSIATCFSCLNDFVFIGFKSGIFEIYNLLTYTTISNEDMKESKLEIKSLVTYKNVENIIGIVVYHSGNGIKIYSFDPKNSKITDSILSFPENVPICKFVNLNEILLICVYEDNICTLHKIYMNRHDKIRSYKLDESIIDSDISVDFRYLCVISNSELKIHEIGSSNDSIDIYSYRNLRKCKFRPKNDFHEWRLIVLINEEKEIYLNYFCGNKWEINLLVEEFSSTVKEIPRTLEWSSDSLYLLIGDYAIRKWKIPIMPHINGQCKKVKLVSTILQTYFGGIQCIQVQDNFIATVDRQGFLYVLKRLN